MQEKRLDAQRRMFQVVLTDGRVICDGVEQGFAAAFARTWNRLIDRGEPGAYIQPLLIFIRKPQGQFDAQHVVQSEGAGGARHGGKQGTG
jgi:hypothetical protein